MDQLVVLARGLGTRMRKSDPTATLAPEQAAAAAGGVKAMIPIGRPFLDYLLSAAADAGYGRACLVVGPEHDQIRQYYARLRPRRLEIAFAIQAEPLGTADAVAAAEVVVGRQLFTMINGDNYYPPEALRGLREATAAAVAAFDADAMLAGSNIPPERLSKFAVLEADSEGRLRRIIEKPDEATLARLPRPLRVSMNCWRFAPSIFAACRSIGRSARGEFEITDAVQYAIDRLGESFQVLRCRTPVLDLSSQGDIEPVARRLAGVKVDL
jgi:dTDP-glucose pyrophosphorylase